jgi:TonB family protein
MLSRYEPVGRKWNPSVVLSVTLHAVIFVALLYHRPAPVYVIPSSVAFGDGQKSYRVTYVAPGPDESIDPVQRRLSFNAPIRKAPRQHSPIIARKQQVNTDKGDISDKSARAGSPFGSLLEGPTSGHDVRPAFPVVFPDPPIARSELGQDVQGDVIVEVTIDAQGNVIATSLLQSIGHGLDEKVLTTLRNWRFKPAMMDGVPIASKHDVHFHFPT